MPRIKRGVTTRAKHKRILDNAKGYYGRRKNTIRIARQAVEKAGQYAYRDRKVKKRSFRALWIQRINAAVRAEGLTYGQFIHALKLADIQLDRKVLADIAMHEAEAFSAIIAQAKAALPKAARRGSRLSLSPYQALSAQVADTSTGTPRMVGETWNRASITSRRLATRKPVLSHKGAMTRSASAANCRDWRQAGVGFSVMARV